MIRAGRLRHRLTLQYKSETRTATGDVAYTWVTDSTVWGAIEPLSGREYIAASQTKNENEVRILMRYNSKIEKSWRIVNDSKAYSITAMWNEDERDRMTVCMCSQGVLDAV
jgi:SPP1 family predicted phage head-tail adaptor